MSRFLAATVVVASVLVLSACQATAPGSNTGDVQTETPAKVNPDEKQGETSKTGTISQAGALFFLNQTGEAPLGIDSYTIDLAQYVGQTVTVTGQYSGDTLFVGEVK